MDERVHARDSDKDIPTVAGSKGLITLRCHKQTGRSDRYRTDRPPESPVPLQPCNGRRTISRAGHPFSAEAAIGAVPISHSDRAPESYEHVLIPARPGPDQSTRGGHSSPRRPAFKLQLVLGAGRQITGVSAAGIGAGRYGPGLSGMHVTYGGVVRPTEADWGLLTSRSAAGSCGSCRLPVGPSEGVVARPLVLRAALDSSLKHNRQG